MSVRKGNIEVITHTKGVILELPVDVYMGLVAILGGTSMIGRVGDMRSSSYLSTDGVSQDTLEKLSVMISDLIYKERIKDLDWVLK